MSEWVKVCLGDLIKVKHGFAFPGQFITSDVTDRILVTPGNFCIGGGFKQGKLKYFSSHDYPAEYQFSGGELIVTMTDLSKETDTLGYSAIVPRDGLTYLHNQRVGLVEHLSDQSDSKFLYWLMRWRDYQEFIVNSASGTSVMHTSPSRICEFEFELPSLPEQKAIASVLSSLDDKIDLLHRQNKTLEEMAETLFRQWFIEEAKEDWEDGTLSDIASNIRINVNTDSIGQDDKYIGLEHIDRRKIALSQHGLGSDVSSNKSRFEPYDILFGKLRPYFHKVCITPFSGICSTDILVLRPKAKVWTAFTLFAFFQDSVVEFANLGSGGTRMPRADWKALSQYPIAIPPINLVEQFEYSIRPSIDKIFSNLEQIQTLGNLRDTLLPKLMSGEVRVQYQTEEVA